ncbi:hypothetical protein FRC09_006897 [Ceratobasidium sp. 395]|nr:hypothetical protein FRC09_006897 [Ceratobasidium sp. 395]
MESNPHKRHRSRKILRTLGFRLGDRSGEATSIPPTANDNVGANIMPDAGPADAGSPPSPLSHEASKETEGSPVIMHSEVVETPEMKTSPRHPLLNTSLPDRAGSSLYPDSVLSAGYQVPTTRRSRLLGSLGLAHVSISSTSSQNTLAHGLTGRTSAPEAATDNPQARSSNNGNAPLARDIAPTPSISYILTPLDATNAVSDTSNSTNESTSHPESAGSTTRKLKESLKKLGTYGSLVPPLGDTITRFIAHIDALPTATLIEENSEPVFSKIAEAADRLNGLFSRLGLVPMAVTISQTLKLKEAQKKGRPLNNKSTAASMTNIVKWTLLFDDYGVFESTNDQLPAENERDIESRLEALNPVKEASYNSTESAGLYRTRCAPNTGELILAGLHDWASDPHSARVCWMKGGAGTGKTTIAYTFCELLKASGQLAGSFFCSRLLPQCQDSNRILSTLAYQFARFNPHFRLALGRALNNQSDSGDSSTIVAQFQNLLTGPLSSIKHRIPFGLFVVALLSRFLINYDPWTDQYYQATLAHICSLN